MSEKLLLRIIVGVSVFVAGLVSLLAMKVLPAPQVDPATLLIFPKMNAIINGTCSVLLILSLWQIKQKNIAAHKKLNLTAFFLSCLFLISYITYHYLSPSSAKFGDLNHDGMLSVEEIAAVGTIRFVYYVILLTHIILAALVLPIVLYSFWFGLKMDVPRHRKIVRWSYPIWLYVTVTGVIVYLMVSPYYVR